MEVYRTLRRSHESEVYKVKGSKFVSFAFPVDSKERAEEILSEIRMKHRKANHCCYAWKIGTKQTEVRFNDDGEPANSAGKPIYGQILSFDLTNVLVAVIRYFGGTKLGVGGLIQSYRESARQCLGGAEVISREIQISFLLRFGYADLDRVMRLIKEMNLEIVRQEMDMNVSLQLNVSRKNETAFRDQVSAMREVKAIELS
jgi:uncharacterized YigZ family protein